MALIFEFKFLFDLFEDSDPVINDQHLYCCGGLLEKNLQFLSSGMIDRIIHHFRKTVVPYRIYIFGNIAKQVADLVSPKSVFFEALQFCRNH